MTTTLRAARPHALAIGLISLVLAACNAATPTATSAPTAAPSPVTSPSATPSPTSAPPSSSPAPSQASGWQPAGSMVLARLGARATILKDGTILVVGNAPCVAAGEPTDSQRAELFDPVTGTWSEVGSLNKARAFLALVALSDGRAMVLGGSNAQSQPYSSTKLYTPAARTWSDGPLMIRAGATQAVTLKNGDVLAVGIGRAEVLEAGATAWKAVKAPTGLDSVDGLFLSGGDPVLSGAGTDGSGPVLQRFDIANGTWSSIEPTDILRPRFISLADGTILAIGDDEGGSHVQRYDAATKNWTDTAQPVQGRIRPQVTVLPDGRVLVAGGVELKVQNVDGGTSVTEGAPLATTEIYDPASDTWAKGPSLGSPRQDGHAVTLADGSVVVFGGYVQSPPPDTNPDTGTPGPCPTPLATTERLAPAS